MEIVSWQVFWFDKRGHTSLKEDPHKGYRKSVSISENSKNIGNGFVGSKIDREDLVETKGISIGSVRPIKSDVLGFNIARCADLLKVIIKQHK